jgi:ribosomal subunit interface protein
MEMTFTGRGVEVTDQIRDAAAKKLASLGRLEPRAQMLHLELISEHHPKVDGMKRIEASLRIPRKTFRAIAEAPEIPTAIDRIKEKLERQLRDHHGKKRVSARGRGLESAPAAAPGGAEEEA